jgi:hypothetical protein
VRDRAPELDKEFGARIHLVDFGDPRGSEKFGVDLLDRLRAFGLKSKSSWKSELEAAGDWSTLATRAIHRCVELANIKEPLPGLLLWTPALSPSESFYVPVPGPADVDPELASWALDCLQCALASEPLSFQITCDQFSDREFASGTCRSLARRLGADLSKFGAAPAGRDPLHLTEVEYDVMAAVASVEGSLETRDLRRLVGGLVETVKSAASRLRSRGLLDNPQRRHGYSMTSLGLKALARARSVQTQVAKRDTR